MIYFVLLSIPLLAGPIRSIPYGRATYRYLASLYFIALILFTGLRWKTGTDWNPYFDFFNDRDNSLRTFEFGYVWLTNAARFFTRDYTSFLLFDSVLAIVPIWYVLWKENDCDPLSLAVFFSYYYTINYLGSNRRIIACALCFLALHALVKRKRALFLGFCLLACCFHRSSVVFLLAWPIYRLKPNRVVYITAIAFAVVFLAINPFQHLVDILGNRTDVLIVSKLLTYSQNTYVSPNVNYGLQDAVSIVKRAMFLALVWWGWHKQTPERIEEYGGLLNLYVFSFAFYLMFTGTIELFKALTIYFSIVELILIPRALACINVKFRPIAYLMFAAMLFAQQYSALNSFWDLYVPYKSVLWSEAQ